MRRRRVEVSKYKLREEGVRRYMDKHPDGEGIFHEWSVNNEELDGGPGHFPVAIVEREDGAVEVIPAELVRFIK